MVTMLSEPPANAEEVRDVGLRGPFANVVTVKVVGELEGGVELRTEAGGGVEDGHGAPTRRAARRLPLLIRHAASAGRPE